MLRAFVPVALAVGLVATQSGVREKPPVATNLGLVGHGGSSTTRPPTVAVSDSGVIYVLWERPWQSNAPRPEGVSTLPKEVTPKQDGWVPAIAICRKGKWTKPGMLVEGKSECAPLFAWCEGELLHLLLMSPGETKCYHLRYDPDRARWEQIGELPIAPSQYEPIRQVGKTVHIACPEKRHVYYFFFNGTAWSKPVRIEQSENRTNLVTRARLAIGLDGVAHVAWWTAPEEKQADIHGYVIIRNGKVEARSLTFKEAPVHEDGFDLGIDAEGKVLMAYQPKLPDGHPDAEKLHVRKLMDKTWSEPDKIAGGWEKLFGEVRVISGAEKTLVSWLAREQTRIGGGVLEHTVRTIATTDGKGRSATRPLAVAADGLFNRSSVPVGPIWLQSCVDKQGRAHVVWGSPEAFHCIVAQLGARK